MLRIKYWYAFFPVIVAMISGMMVLTGIPSALYGADSMLTVENEFIKIIVNNEAKDQGRFSVETTAGDPQNPSDNNKPLIYGRPIPWTSYTTVRIDGKNYIFGGESTKTQLRTNQTLNFGKVVSQTTLPEGVVTTAMFGPVKVIQSVTFFRNPATRVKDNVLIAYEVINEDTVAHDVGIRIMMDTKLGDNDGAPFRIGGNAYDAEIRFSGKDLFDYWQAFDNLVSPNVIAQGTIRDQESGIMPPDRMFLVNWGTLLDNPWDFTYTPDRSFIRVGEFEKDTALALYWDPERVEPGKSLWVKTLYGLGGVTLSPGELSLGLTAPAESYATSRKEFLIVGYVLNSGGFDSQNTIARFDLPAGFKVTSGETERELGLLPAGETRQIPVKVMLDNPAIGKQFIRFSVHSNTLEPNSIRRGFDVLAPPDIAATLQVPQEKVVTYNPYIDIVLTLTNPTQFGIENISTELTMDDHFLLPQFELRRKTIDLLSPNETVKVNWKVAVKESQVNNASISVGIESPATRPKFLTEKVNIGLPEATIRLEASKENIAADDYFYVWFFTTYSRSITDLSAQISYDPAMVEFLRWTPEAWLVQTGQVSDVQLENGIVTVTDVDKPLAMPLQRIFKLHFRAKQAGKTDMVLKQGETIRFVLPLTVETK